MQPDEAFREIVYLVSKHGYAISHVRNEVQIRGGEPVAVYELYFAGVYPMPRDMDNKIAVEPDRYGYRTFYRNHETKAQTRERLEVLDVDRILGGA